MALEGVAFFWSFEGLIHSLFRACRKVNGERIISERDICAKVPNFTASSGRSFLPLALPSTQRAHRFVSQSPTLRRPQTPSLHNIIRQVNKHPLKLDEGH